jgi:osmotically inducible protein OsmC
MIRKAKAVWRGIKRAGDGDLTTDSGTLDKIYYSFTMRFGNQRSTNPEELIGAARAGCSTMGLAYWLQAAGYTPTDLSTEAAVSLDPEGSGVGIRRSALTLCAKVSNLAKAAFAEFAKEAELNVPVSKALTSEITLDAKLTRLGRIRRH